MTAKLQKIPYSPDNVKTRKILDFFDNFEMLDQVEHHILIFLAKYLIVDSSTTEEPAFPSVQEICMYTKISPTVLKKRLKSLSVKGFLLVEEVKFRTPGVRFLHTHFNYSLTPMAEGYFRENDKPLIFPAKKAEEGTEEKPVYGPPYIHPIICEESEEKPVYGPPYSPPIIYEEPVVEPSTASADRVLKAWESEFSTKVSSEEIEKFYTGYERENQPEEYYFHNIHLISRDPLLSKNIWTPNFLFSQLGRKTIERFSLEQCRIESPELAEQHQQVEQFRSESPAIAEKHQLIKRRDCEGPALGDEQQHVKPYVSESPAITGNQQQVGQYRGESPAIADEQRHVRKCENEIPAKAEKQQQAEYTPQESMPEVDAPNIEKPITNCNFIKDHEDLTREILRLLKLDSGEDYQRILRNNLLALRVYKFDRSLSILERSLRGLNIPHIPSGTNARWPE